MTVCDLMSRVPSPVPTNYRARSLLLVLLVAVLTSYRLILSTAVGGWAFRSAAAAADGQRSAVAGRRPGHRDRCATGPCRVSKFLKRLCIPGNESASDCIFDPNYFCGYPRRAADYNDDADDNDGDVGDNVVVNSRGNTAAPLPRAFAFVLTHLADASFVAQLSEAAAAVRAFSDVDIVILTPPLDESSDSATPPHGFSIVPELYIVLKERLAAIPRTSLMTVPWPVTEEQLAPNLQATLRREKNCCGWREFLKLALWGPAMAARYRRVVYLDADVRLLSPSIDNVFGCGAGVGRGAFPDALYTKGAMSPLNGGFLSLRPDVAIYDALVTTVITTPYSNRGYWGGTRGGGGGQEGEERGIERERRRGERDRDRDRERRRREKWPHPLLRKVPDKLRKVHHGKFSK